MANWMHRLDLKDLWKKRDVGEITVQQLGKEIAKRIRKLKCFKRYEDVLEDIAVEFGCVDESTDEFDLILKELYDWADEPVPTPVGQMQRKNCWVATVI